MEADHLAMLDGFHKQRMLDHVMNSLLRLNVVGTQDWENIYRVKAALDAAIERANREIMAKSLEGPAYA